MEQHLNQARRNHGVFQVLSDEGYVDWAITALFYTALRLADAWLTEQVGRGATSHNDRRNRLALLLPADALAAYQQLREMSELARYGDWTAVIDADRLTELHEGPYRLLCQQLGAPDALMPE